jgi:EpsI family protein
MCVAAGLAVAATPTVKMADVRPKIELERVIPESFGDWGIDRSIVPLLISPEVQAKLDKIYNQTLARTYRNARGDRVMLSIAYGGDQSDSMRAHRPEVCYAAQGFNVIRSLLSQVVTRLGVLPVKRLIAVKGQRTEPITYWMVVGDRVVLNGWEQKLAQLRYGLTGSVPDGILVRVSTIDAEADRAFAVQDAFVRDLLPSIQESMRTRVVGRFVNAS